MPRLLDLAVRGEKFEQHAAHHQAGLVGWHVALDTRVHVERHIEVGTLEDRAILLGDAAKAMMSAAGASRSVSLRKQNCTIWQASSAIGVAAVTMMWSSPLG